VSEGLRAETAARLLRAVALVQHESRQPSLVAAVVRDGGMVWSAVRGTEAGNCEPSLDTQYRIGSITKTITALTLLQCRDEGLVDLDTTVGSVLGEVPFAGASLRQLLSHAAGLPAEPEGPWWERCDGGDFEELSDRLRDEQPVLPAGRQQHYSNLGYALVGEAVGRVRSQPYQEVARQRVLEPLGMVRTTYHPQVPHAQGYSVHPWSGRLVPEPHTDTGAMGPAGQWWSTAADLCRYAAFWLDPDPCVLAPETVAEMRIPVAGQADDGLEAGYGLGLSLAARPGRTVFGHGGSMPGFLASMVMDPQQRTAAVALSNGTAGETLGLGYTLLDLVAEYEPQLPQPWRPEPELAAAEDLLGQWFWGNTPYTLEVADGHLVLDTGRPGRGTRLVPDGEDRWRGLDQYFTGETLRVHRASDSSIRHLNLATYTLTRTPYGT